MRFTFIHDIGMNPGAGARQQIQMGQSTTRLPKYRQRIRARIEEANGASTGCEPTDDIGYLPPHHRPIRCSANKNAPALETVGRSNGHCLDAAGVDCEAIMEGWLIKIAVDWAEIGKIGSAAGHRIKVPVSRHRARYAAYSDYQCSNDSGLGGVRHIPILEIYPSDGDTWKVDNKL